MKTHSCIHHALLTSTFPAQLLCVILSMLLAATSALAQFGFLNPTDEARLHAGIVDATTGAPLKGTAIRVIGDARHTWRTGFTTQQIKSMDTKLDIFGRYPVSLTGDDGTVTFEQVRFVGDDGKVTLKSPLDLDIMILLSAVITGHGHLVANHPGARPLSARAGISYMLTERATSQYGSGTVFAGYLAPMSLVTEGRSSEPATKESLPLQELTAEVTPLVVRAGGKVDVMIRWSYVKLPLMKSLVKVGSDDKALLTVPPKGSGRAQETWQSKDREIGKVPGPKSIEIKAYLDDPHLNLPAATIKVVCYVAASEAEEKAYHSIFKAGKIDMEHATEAIAICEEVVTDFPHLTQAWAELGKRHAFLEHWEELESVWGNAPPAAKETFSLASAIALAAEKRGDKGKRWGNLVVVAGAADAPPAARALCFQDALKAKKFEVALRIWTLMEKDMSGGTASASRARESPSSASASITVGHAAHLAMTQRGVWHAF